MSAAGVLQPNRQSGAVNETCPRCHTTQEWGEASWCPACGFYPVVDGSDNDSGSWADTLPDLPQEHACDNQSALQSIPGWLWALLSGVVAITSFSVTIRLLFPENDQLRGTVALTQLTAGLITMLIAHGIAARQAMKCDRRINANDILLSWFSVWHPTIDQLPRTCKRVWCVVWGIIAVVTATTIIGGIDYGAPFRVHEGPKLKPMSVVGKVAAAAAAQAKAKEANLGQALDEIRDQTSEAQAMTNGNASASMETALNELGDVEGELQNMKAALDDAVNEMGSESVQQKTKSLECRIYGVVTDHQNVPQTFLFAANTRGVEQHVAEIQTDDLPRNVFRTIAVRLYREIQAKPLVATDRKAVWVKPVVTCRLEFTGYSEDGKLLDPRFDAIVVQQRGRFDPEPPNPESLRQRNAIRSAAR